MLWLSPALAGPPYITDDPEPTDTGHWENYLFVEGARVEGQRFTPMAGIELNYGAFENTQLTLSVPLNPNPGPGGIGVVWAPLGMGVKYRFIQEDEDGWRPQVAFFPSVAIPVGPANAGAPVTELLAHLDAEILRRLDRVRRRRLHQQSRARATATSPITASRLQNQVTKDLALGVEVFGADKDSVDGHATSAVGLAALYDFNDLWHVVGSVNTGISNAHDADQFSYNLALKWTP